MHVKIDFLCEKNEKTAREGKKKGVKNLKNGPKSGREKRKQPVKKIKKKAKNSFHGHFLFSWGKNTGL